MKELDPREHGLADWLLILFTFSALGFVIVSAIIVAVKL
jgi:hypothetical protein